MLIILTIWHIGLSSNVEAMKEDFIILDNRMDSIKFILDSMSIKKLPDPIVIKKAEPKVFRKKVEKDTIKVKKDKVATPVVVKEPLSDSIK
jgi:hypothetical protein